MLSISSEFSDSIPLPSELIYEIPLIKEHERRISHYRKTIINILNGADERRLLIVGPCSIHDLRSTYEYALQLQRLAKDLSEHFFIVMRTYFEKPRTTRGWKGFLYDPHLDGSHDMASGLRWARKLLVDLTEMEIPVGCELLELHTAHYLTDLLSWGCIGARTSTSQPHRQLAASLPIPCGFKNTTDGNIDNALHGIISAASSHYFLGLKANGKLSRIYAPGNPNCHLILRGGENGPNYDATSVQFAAQRCKQAGIVPSFLVDCSHDNCNKRHEKQKTVFDAVMNQILEGNRNIVGVMLESHLNSGNQPLTLSPQYGVSVTDPCLSWKDTEVLLRAAHEKFSQSLCLSL